ncbi:MAG: tRNA dihydrouridine synthase DusB, partial [Pedobacter sp.]
PWIFREIKHFYATGEILPPPTLEERITACRTHLQKSIEWKGPKVGIFEMRRHYANYFKGLPDFKQYRMLLVKEENIETIHQLLDEVAEKYEGVLPFSEMA